MNEIASKRQLFDSFFNDQGWHSQPFQVSVFEYYASEKNIFISVPTGSGKTIAAFLPALIDLTVDNLMISKNVEVVVAPNETIRSFAFEALKNQKNENSRKWNSLVNTNIIDPDFRRKERKVTTTSQPIKGIDGIPGTERDEGSKEWQIKEKKLFKTKALKKSIKIIYISPLKAVARDIQKAVISICSTLKLDLAVETRTGDDSSYSKSRQYSQPPEILITTPESLSLFLTREKSRNTLEEIELIIVDEWHELYHSKRGTQIELLMASLRGFSPSLKTIGISATLANDSIAERLFPNNADFKIVTSETTNSAEIDIVTPKKIERFPWAGHMGLSIFDEVLRLLKLKNPFLLFTNTRFQAESWYQRIMDSGEFQENEIGLHHGSLSIEERHSVENGIKIGILKGVVCTSSLDLGIDFPAVKQVFQVGNPKSIARLLQRAGRAEHSPGKTPKVTLIPTNSWELFEFLALMNNSNLNGKLEKLPVPASPFDVLVQHLVTLACVGFEGDETYHRIRTTAAFKNLDKVTWNEILNFLTSGGESLSHYPDFKKLVDLSGFYQVGSELVASIHRLSIGTISGSDQIEIKLRGQKTLGFLDSYFADHLEKGEQFNFSGKVFEVVIKSSNQLIVKVGRGRPSKTSSWGGSALPLSESVSGLIKDEFGKLATAFMIENQKDEGLKHTPILSELEEASPIKRYPQNFDLMHSNDIQNEIPKDIKNSLLALLRGKEDQKNIKILQQVFKLLKTQSEISEIPSFLDVFVEIYHSKFGEHAYIYTLEGLRVNEALGNICIFALQRAKEGTFTLTTNDYGFELTAPLGYDLGEILTKECFTRRMADEYITQGLNWNDIEKKEFRNIAETAGLVIKGPPQTKKSIRYLQASSNLFFEVFKKHEPTHFLLRQARAQAMINFLESNRLFKVIDLIEKEGIRKTHIKSLTPLSFPLFVARITNRASNEKINFRIERLLRETLESSGIESPVDKKNRKSKTTVLRNEIKKTPKKNSKTKAVVK